MPVPDAKGGTGFKHLKTNDKMPPMNYESNSQTPWTPLSMPVFRQAPSVTGWIDPRSNGNFRVDLYLRGNVLEVFVDRRVALTHRTYSTAPISPIVYAEDGIAEFHASLWTHGEGLR